MDFTLDKKHEMARSLFREFAENEVKPLAQEVDETEEFPVENVKKMQKLGVHGHPRYRRSTADRAAILSAMLCA